jgi:hypothetical protein
MSLLLAPALNLAVDAAAPVGCCPLQDPSRHFDRTQHHYHPRRGCLSKPLHDSPYWCGDEGANLSLHLSSGPPPVSRRKKTALLMLQPSPVFLRLSPKHLRRSPLPTQAKKIQVRLGLVPFVFRPARARTRSAGNCAACVSSAKVEQDPQRT